MAVPASKVKAICTTAEASLVRASRKPVLNELTSAELKRNAVRARKLFDKWQGLSRGQSRDRRRRTGSSDIDPNTQLKAQIFREALDGFEAQLAKTDQAAPRTGNSARAKATKKIRGSEHRATRAAVRKAATVVKKSINATSGKQQAKAATPSVPAERAAPTKANKPAAKPSVAKKTGAAAAKKALPPAKGRASTSSMTASQQREAITAAKKSRLARSGKSTRMAGHISARGKRAQARRDAKN